MKSREEMVIFARETMGLPQEVPVEFSQLTRRGSDRTYFRIRWNPKNSVILVHYKPIRIENTLFAEIAQFLQDNGIPVPQIIRHDAAGCLIIMQDLGDTNLWSLRDASWHTRQILYQKTLSVAHKLHSCDERLIHSGHVKLMDPFGPDLYLWERNYFRDNFVGGFCETRLEPDTEEQLENELSGLAKRLLTSGPILVHRDLQSQNVMICDEAPFLIDFQGMRFGTRFYDLGSLICDPYVAFSESERMELLSFYYGLSRQEFDWAGFQRMFWEASAQRLMQALGAYGYLGYQRGLKNYLAHVPAGLRNLRTAAENAASLPKLLEICTQCQKVLQNNNSKCGDIRPEPRI